MNPADLHTPPLPTRVVGLNNRSADMPMGPIPDAWKKWCKSGVHGKGPRKRKALARCLVGEEVRGYLSDLPLNPSNSPTDSMYPSIEHLSGQADKEDIVVEARIINDMKSHLSEREFWLVVEHLFSVGVSKGKIRAPFCKRLPDSWKPERHYLAESVKPVAETRVADISPLRAAVRRRIQAEPYDPRLEDLIARTKG